MGPLTVTGCIEVKPAWLRPAAVARDLGLKRIVRKIWRRLPGWLRLRLVRTSQAKFTASAAVVIANEEGKVLLLDHVLRPFSGWGLPGGFIGRGEHPEEAIRREIEEETGLRLLELRFCRVRTVDRHIEFIYMARCDGKPAVNSREILDLGWFGPDELPPHLSPAQKDIIAAALESKL